MFLNPVSRIVELSKWPAATITAISLPNTIHATIHCVYNATNTPFYFILFSAGIASQLILSRSRWASSRYVAMVFRWNHDLTQFLFTQLLGWGFVEQASGQHAHTSRPAKELCELRNEKQFWGEGHEVDSTRDEFKVERQSLRPKRREIQLNAPRIPLNWLGLVLPYMFPTAALASWIIALVLPSTLRCFLLGFGIGIHSWFVSHHLRHDSITSKRVGSGLIYFFLLPANVFLFGITLAFALNGFAGIADFLHDWIVFPAQAWRGGRALWDHSLRMLGHHRDTAITQFFYELPCRFWGK